MTDNRYKSDFLLFSAPAIAKQHIMTINQNFKEILQLTLWSL